MKRSLTALFLSLVVAALTGAAPNASKGASLKIEYPGKVIDCQGVAALRPANQERWTPLETSMLLSKGDWIRTEVRGANAVQIRLANQDCIILSPGGLIELIDENTVNLIRGEAEVTPVKDGKLTVRLPGDVAKSFRTSTILRVTETAYTVLGNEPNWLKYLKGKVTHESMGALVAKVEGRDLPLTLGYHKVTVDIRDQIARTVIEESFVNHTRSQLEGVFFFPLPQDASISGFAMWIGDELVEADVVEKERAREIYETILREKRDPGLLEWTGGNIFKARVFPIFPHSEKRIRITYTQVLPRNGNQYRYSYALQSEMLKQTPLRELEVKVNIFSEEPIDKVACLSHNARVNRTKNAATVEFAAQEYTPTQDFEVEIDVKQGDEPIVLIPHRRGDDGYFLLMVNPPEKQRKIRPVLGDGPPLDLIVVADTSASMDRQQRQLQDQFIGFLLGSLGKQDRFRVAAVDAHTVWFNPTTNTPPDTPRTAGSANSSGGLVHGHPVGIGSTESRPPIVDSQEHRDAIMREGEPPGEPSCRHSDHIMPAVELRNPQIRDASCIPSEENIEKARTFLANRVSLGWTDLAKTLEEVLKFAGKNTHIVYVGDGIDTSKDNDPGSIAKSLKRIYIASGSAAAVHAVAVSGSYEPMVMKTMAGLGGGSFRRLEGTAPARNGAMGLLQELTTPGIRDMKVEFKGLRVTKVYPDELPNLPAGRQQIVLGRYLPEGKGKKGTVSVSGEYKGKAVRYEATVSLKDAESGNAFIPRLWARMHLDSLLEQGQTAEVKSDIIALSEEYAIMTPYTSFLVLESDKDRERFSVKRRFKMRDGEKFFAEGRDSANFQLRQKQMQLAGTWRQDLRRQVLRDLMTMGRVLPSPQPYGDSYAACSVTDEDAVYTSSGRLRPMSGLFCRPILSPRSSSAPQQFGSQTEESWTTKSNGRLLDGSDTLGFDNAGVSDYFDADREGLPAADTPAEPGFGDSDGELDLRKEGGKWAEDRAYDGRADFNERGRVFKSKSLMRRSGRGGKMSGNYANADYVQRCSEIGYDIPEYRNNWLNTLFPHLPPAPPLTATPVNTNWSEAARALSRSLLRQDKLNEMTGGIEIRTTRKAFDCRRNVTIAQTVSETLYSAKSWVQTVRPDSGQTIMNWYDGKERGVFAPCYQLGRHRAAEASDANLREPGNHDFSCASLESSYSGCTAELRNQDDATALLVLRYQHNAAYEMRYRIDTTKHVLLAFETWNVGRLQSRTTYADFIEVAGAWWATNISVENGEGRQTSSATVAIRPVDERTFTKESESRMAVTRKDSVLIAEPLPTLSDAKQAEKDTKVSFDQFLTLVSQHMQLQEHDKALADWVAAKTLVKDRPGAEWLETEVLLQIRRNEEARQKIRKSSAKLAAAPIPDDLYLANALYNQMCRIGQHNEVLTLLDDLKPVYERQPKHLSAMASFFRLYAETLRNVGRAEEAVVIWQRLAGESPSDLGIQTRYVQVLAEMGNPEIAFDYVTQLLAKSDSWTREERDSIRSSVAYTFMNGIQTDKWLAFVEAWMADGTPNQNACQFYLSALYSMNKVADMRRVVTSWIEEGMAAYASTAPVDQADSRRQLAIMRLQPAIQMALGQGYNVYTDYVDPYWYPLLSRTVKELFNNDNAMSIAGQIIQNYRFSQTDEARKLRQHFVTVLSKEALTLKPRALHQVIAWVSMDNPKVDMEVWKDVVERLEGRWAKETNSVDKSFLSGVVVTILRKSDPETGLTRFLRRQYQESPKEQVPGHAQTLFYHLLGGKWSEAVESEIFVLLPKLSATTNCEQRIGELLPCLYDLTDHLTQARIKAGGASSEARSEMTRQELAAEQNRLRTAAREGLVARLSKESPNQEDILRPWFTIERLCIEVQLNKDAKSIAGECWELLPPKPWVNTETNWFRLHLLDRAMTTLACLASRKSADAQLVTRVHAYIDAGIAAKETGDDPAGSYWRYQKYRLLVARDESKVLEEALAKWITPGKADPTWRYAMGYLMAEQGRIADAIRQFEILEKADLLDQPDYRALAGWYMAADQRDKHEAALVKAMAKVPDYELSNRLYRYLNIWQQNNEKVPTELDPEVTRIFAALFDKAQNPADYLGQLREFYQRSRDARLLRCMAEGMFGHTAQRTYPFVQSMTPVLNEIRDEAVADALLQRIGELRPRAKTTVDNRALDFLEMQVCRRAAEVRNQPGPHIAKALAAMQCSFTGDWATGERRLMADLLASLGKIAGEELVREQLRQLRELHKCRTEPAEDRLAIAAHLARALWTCEKQDDAIDILDAALTEYRQTMNGVLPASANNAIESYVAYLEGRQRFTCGESWLQAELGRPANQQQQYWLVRRLLTLYVNTVQAKAEVTMGADAALCRATYAKMVPELDRPDRNHRRAVLSLACNLFEAAKRTVIESPEAREFAFTVCPAVLARETEPSTYRNQVTQVGRMLKTVLGPLTSLEFLVERLEREPQWLSLNRNYPGWQTYAYELGRCREDARPTGTIETRLLNVVTAELRRDLTERRELNRCIYARHNNYFWSEKAAEFKSVAEAVWREQKASGATVLHIANYLWNGLEEYDRVIEMLAEAHGNQLLDEQGQSILVSYLHARNRFAESIPILPGLIEQRPDTMNYRTQLMAAYFKVQDGDKLRKTLTEADRHFHEGGRWQEGNIAGLAYACVKAALNEESVKYYEELIPLRKRNLGGRIVGDCALPEYYRQLANAQIGLGRTVEAVEAASGSTVMWSQDQYTRNNAMNVLQDVLRRSPDLAGYVTNLEKQVAENNMENPIVRKALGRVFLEKNDTKEAIRHLSLAMDVQPNDRETCDAIVSAYDRMNDKPGAIRQILTTVDLSRRDIALYAELGRRYLADGDSTESERAYLSIAEMLPNESESHTMLAEIRQQQNRWDKAIHHWRQVVRVRSLEPTGFQRLANALIHQKQWKEAIENIDILAKREWPQRFGNVRAMAEQLRRQVPVK